MKNLKKYFYFLIILSASIFVINFTIIDQIKSNITNVNTFTLFQTNHHHSKADVLILGNSTTRNLNLALIKKNVINASSDANTPTHYLNDLHSIKSNLKSGPVIVYTFTPWTMFRNYYKYSEKSFLMSITERYKSFKSMVHLLYPTANRDSFYKILGSFFQNKNINRINKMIQRTPPETPLGFKEHTSDREAIDYSDFKISEVDIKATKEILKLSKGLDGKLLIIMPPISSIRREFVMKTKSIVLKELPEIANNLVDLTDLIPDQKEVENFYDSNHLNQMGLEVFAKKLNEIIIKLHQ